MTGKALKPKLVKSDVDFGLAHLQMFNAIHTKVIQQNGLLVIYVDTMLSEQTEKVLSEYVRKKSANLQTQVSLRVRKVSFHILKSKGSG